jgi:hypothetical protein
MQEDQSLLPLDARKGRTAAAIVSILREERVNHGTFCRYGSCQTTILPTFSILNELLLPPISREGE